MRGADCKRKGIKQATYSRAPCFSRRERSLSYRRRSANNSSFLLTRWPTNRGRSARNTVRVWTSRENTKGTHLESVWLPDETDVLWGHPSGRIWAAVWASTCAFSRSSTEVRNELTKWTTAIPNIFLSYACGDDVDPFDPVTSFVAGLHRDLTVRSFEVWCDRMAMPSRGLSRRPRAVGAGRRAQRRRFRLRAAGMAVRAPGRQGDHPNPAARRLSL